MTSRRCKDCATQGITSRRKAPYPGPRCHTHNRAQRTRRRDNDHGRRLEAVYGITAQEYADILEYQGGKCAICQRSTGKRKRLSVDHEHVEGNAGPVRGLLCGPCNRDVLGWLRDDVDALQRAIDYLLSPPAYAVIGERWIPFGDDET